MAEVRFLVDDIKENRYFDVMVDGQYLATITPKLKNKLLYIEFKATYGETIGEGLRDIFYQSMVNYLRWDFLTDRYYDFLQNLYESYFKTEKCDIIRFFYKSVVVDFEAEDFEKGNLLEKIENWLDNILEKIGKDIKLETIIPLNINLATPERCGLEINAVEFEIVHRNSMYYEAKISSNYGDFYAAFVLGILYNNNEVVRKSIDRMLKICSETETGEIKNKNEQEIVPIKDGKWPTPYKF